MLDGLIELLNELNDRVDKAKGYLDFENKSDQLDAFEEKMNDASFWTSSDKDEVIKNVKNLKLLVEPWRQINQSLEHSKDYCDLLEGQDEESLLQEVEQSLKALKKRIDREELKVMLGQEEDSCNAFIAINAGAGGTESCDWVSMLLRMYQRWAEDRGFTVKTVDYLAGEEAGVKNVILLISGPYAFGYLRSERGVHRLVRISPFDSNKKRHTSFASVDVTPEIDENMDLEVNEVDIRVDTYRSGGAGGQHVNTTDSAVRITHEPTGIVVQCQNERSQHKNKASAMKMLKSKLYEKELQDRRAKVDANYSQKGDISWGNQIRSYVFQPYTMVKDHRTNAQSGNIPGVMDGSIDLFIEAYLKWNQS